MARVGEDAFDRTLVIACGALAREIIDLRACNGWDHIELTCLPADLHNTPDAIPAAVADAVRHAQGDHDRILVAYGDCGTGGRLAATCAALGVEMIEAPHCYAMYEGAAQHARRDDEIDAFYLTDFLARQFDAFVWRPLGLDRHPQLRDTYFAHYRKLVYLAQTDDAALDRQAQDHARRLKLSYERRVTGYGDLAGWLAPR